jgi:signal transduction histidine kinase
LRTGAGTDGAGVFRYNGSEFKPYGGKGDAANLNVNVILEDTHTNVWIGSAGGFWRINGNQIESAAGPEPVMKNVQVIFEDRSGRLWLGSRNSLACQNRGIWERIRDTEGIIHSDIRSVAEDSHGAIWAAAYGQGLYRITEMQAELIGTNHARGLAMACALHIDRDGTLWIGAFGGGLMRYKDGAFTLWTSKDGLIGDEILALAEDDAGTLWMSSNQGIFGCSKLELEGHVLNGNLRLLCRQLLPEDGLSSLACSGIGQPAATRASDGKLWLCNNDALAVLDAGGRRKKVWPAPVLLDEVRVDNVPQALGDLKPLRVRASARRFEFHFTSPQVNSARGLLFRYQLEGMDSGWVDAGPQRERVASYSQLPYGNYRFRVMAGDEAAGWRELIPPLSLEITPRWWQSLWFRILGALSLIAAAGGAAALVERRKLGLRLRKLEMQQALENERRRIARDLHDDLGSQMTEIVLMGELAKRGDQTSNELSAQVRNLTQRIRELVTSMGDTVWTINPRNDSLPNLAAYLCDHAERFLSPTRVSCRLDVAEELPDVMLASQTRQNVFLVVKEALNNAVKHSDATTVSLRLWIQDGLLKIEVQDNGMGFDVHQPGVLGNGLNNIRIRMENLGGRARITSETGEGTTVYLEMPLSLSDGSRPKVAAEEAREDL